MIRNLNPGAPRHLAALPLAADTAAPVWLLLGAIAFACFCYLLAAVLWPERF